MICRPLWTLAECQQAEALQMQTWGELPLDVVPAHMLLALARHGGCLLGAFQEEQMAGMALAFLAPGYLYSHLACVAPERRSQGVGLALKQAQRDWALQHGLERIVWTFDPYSDANARFNFQKVGVTARRFYPHYYGDMDDDLNRGRPSDRLEVDWWLHRDSPPAERWLPPQDVQEALSQDWTLVDYRDGLYGAVRSPL